MNGNKLKISCIKLAEAYVEYTYKRGSREFGLDWIVLNLAKRLLSNCLWRLALFLLIRRSDRLAAVGRYNRKLSLGFGSRVQMQDAFLLWSEMQSRLVNRDSWLHYLRLVSLWM